MMQERPSNAESRALLDWFERRPAVLSLDLRGDGEDIEIPKEHGNDEAKYEKCTDLRLFP